MRGLFVHAWGAVVAVAIIVGLWVPVVSHYHVQSPALDDAALQPRATPPDAVLDAATRFRFLLPGLDDEAGVVAAARRALEGRLELLGYFDQSIDPRFSAADLEGDGATSLYIASLGVASLLLDAYAFTGEERFLGAAVQHVDGFARFEAAAWLPSGALWNDHAIATRAGVLARFWRIYRSSVRFDTDVAQRVRRLAQRNAAMLAKPGHYTYATNHGVMQNLALMLSGIAFPDLPQAARFLELGSERLAQQIPHYVSEEGVVLEHSFGYHEVGVTLLDVAIRYLALAGKARNPDWEHRLERARDVAAMLARADGSIPLVGDTRARRSALAAPSVAPDRVVVLPISGYALWRQTAEAGSRSHVAVAWSHFPGHGHKHADELAFTLWADGQSWLSGVGYWPYRDARRARAVGWASANAPHAVGEPTRAVRTSKLLASGSAQGIVAVDIERRAASGFAVRRQVVALRARDWIVIDTHRNAPAGGVQVMFNTASAVAVDAAADPACRLLRGAHSANVLQACVVGVPPPAVQLLKGSESPLTGWEIDERRAITPVPALHATSESAQGWVASTWSLGTSDGEPPTVRVESANAWRVAFAGQPAPLVITRSGDDISISGGAAVRPTSLTLRAPPDPALARARIVAAMAENAARHPESPRLHVTYRARITWLLLVALALQELVLGVLWWARRRRVAVALRGASLVCWLAGGTWLSQVYFAT